MASPLAQYQQAMAAQIYNGFGLTQAQTQATALNNQQIAGNAASEQAARFGQAAASNAQAASITANTPSEIAARDAQTGQVAMNAASDRQARAAAVALSGAQIGSINAKLPGEIASTDANTQGTLLTNQTILPKFNSDLTGANINQSDALFRQNLGIANPAYRVPAVPGVVGYAHGTSKVTAGKGGPKPKATDHIPALLSDGEAVLNRGAAEHMGRGVIDHLNKLGMMRMAAQHEVSKHVAAIAKHAGKGGKPKAGTIGHFLTGTGDVVAPSGSPASAPSGQAGGLNLAALLGGQGSGPAGGGDPLSAALASLGGPSQAQGGASAAPAGGGSPVYKSPSRHHKRR